MNGHVIGFHLDSKGFEQTNRWLIRGSVDDLYEHTKLRCICGCEKNLPLKIVAQTVDCVPISNACHSWDIKGEKRSQVIFSEIVAFSICIIFSFFQLFSSCIPLNISYSSSDYSSSVLIILKEKDLGD
ncbi:unnamed protein product [Porites evermanni]|uniref:Uncharacterized protein n=1 Tax=Porites evermanni TaxID=104178 RepID=A0ABN8QF18_9CNID|nr:unnamed protein product [Porites evermanni]